MQCKSVTRKKTITLPKISAVANKNSDIISIKVLNNLPKDLKSLLNKKKNYKEKLNNWIKLNYQIL